MKTHFTRGSGLLLAAALGLSLLAGTSVAQAAGEPGTPRNVRVDVVGRSVDLEWAPVAWPGSGDPGTIAVVRNGLVIADLAGDRTSFSDGTVTTNGSYIYAIQATIDGSTASSVPVEVTTPGYFVGAAIRDITPVEEVNLGGFGLGDGSVIPDSEVVGRGGRAGPSGEHIAARALVVDDGTKSIAIADIETQGMFAAYEMGPVGLEDMAAQVAQDIPGLPAENILIATDHTHSGPDTIGVWGGVPEEYFTYVKDQTVAAIEAAYEQREFASIAAGHSDASDLVYNQSCTEALNQDKDPVYPGPEVCATPGKDGLVRVLQATAPSGDTVATYMAFAAHATAGGGSAIHGDWPQFLSEEMTKRFGGTGIAMVGALGGTQPCRAACGFTKHDNPGYDAPDRRTSIVKNYMAHVDASLDSATEVSGPVDARKDYIREPITGPFVMALFTGGNYAGTEILRSHQNPWVVGNTIRTVVASLRIGNVLFSPTPGEGFPAIGFGVRDAIEGEQEVIQLGLANDQLGYLIAPTTYVPIIAAEAAVNDNIIFNVSPTIGDHVMCANIRMSLEIGFDGTTPPMCEAFNATDGAGDPVAQLPLGGLVLPDRP